MAILNKAGVKDNQRPLEFDESRNDNAKVRPKVTGCRHQILGANRDINT